MYYKDGTIEENIYIINSYKNIFTTTARKSNLVSQDKIKIYWFKNSCVNQRTILTLLKKLE